MNNKNFENIIGMTIENARQIVETTSFSGTTCYVMRIVKMDTITIVNSINTRFYRVNVEVENNKISKVVNIG